MSINKYGSFKYTSIKIWTIFCILVLCIAGDNIPM